MECEVRAKASSMIAHMNAKGIVHAKTSYAVSNELIESKLIACQRVLLDTIANDKTKH